MLLSKICILQAQLEDSEAKLEAKEFGDLVLADHMVMRKDEEETYQEAPALAQA